MRKNKLFVIINSLLIIFLLGACGNNPNDTSIPSDVSVPSEIIPSSSSSSTTGGKGDESDTSSTHTHTYSSTWSYNDTYHWHEATCGHDTKSAYFKHSFNSWQDNLELGIRSRNCKTCGYVQKENLQISSHTHTFDEGYVHDENSHWHPSTCGHDDAVIKEDHIFENYLEYVTEDGYTFSYDSLKCSVCGYIARGTHTHIFSPDWAYDDNTHWHPSTCGHFNLKNEEGPHEFGEWIIMSTPTNEYEQGVRYRECYCGKIEYDYFYISHTPSYDEDSWSFNEDYHYHACLEHPDNVDEYKDMLPHSGRYELVLAPTNDSTGSIKMICDFCGYEKTKILPVLNPYDYNIVKTDTKVDCQTESHGWDSYTFENFYETFEGTVYGKHNYVNGVCLVCGKTEISEGLSFRPSSDSQSYYVNGIGDFTGDRLIIPATRNGLPVIGIDDGAFANNLNLTYVSIPNSVIYLGKNIFSGCKNINELAIYTDEFMYINPEGYSEQYHLPISYLFGTLEYENSVAVKQNIYYTKENVDKFISGTYYIPSTLTKISAYATRYAFENLTTIKEIDILSSNSIELKAFSNTTSLEKLTINYDLVTSIAGYAFSHSNVIIDLSSFKALKTIYSSAFYGYEHLPTKLVIPDSVETIHFNAFPYEAVKDVEEIVLPFIGNEANTIYTKNYFSYIFGNSYDDNGIFTPEANNIPKNLKTLTITGYNHFTKNSLYGLKGLEHLYINDPTCYFDDETILNNLNSNIVNIYDNGKYLGSEENPYLIYLTCLDSDLEEINFHPDTKTIAKNSLRLSNVKDLVIPDYIIYLYDFYAYNMESLTLPFNYTINPSYTDTPSLYQITSLKDYLPETLKSFTLKNGLITRSFFSDCKYLEKIILEDNVVIDYKEGIVIPLFNDCINLREIKIPSVSSIYFGDLFSKDENQNSYLVTIQYRNPNPYGVDYYLYHNYYIPNNLTKVTIKELPSDYNEFFFSYSEDGYKSITDITIGHLEIINTNTFKSLPNLDNLTILDGLTTIADKAFMNSSIQKFNAPDTLKIINHYAFSNCTKLQEFSLANVIKIGGYAFNNCHFTNINLNEDIEYIGENAFTGNDGLIININDTSSLTYIGTGAFNGATINNILNLNNDNLEIADKAFLNAKGVEEIHILSANSVGKNIFEGTNLTSITLPYISNNHNSNIKTLGYYFQDEEKENTYEALMPNNGELKKYYFPTSLTSVTILGGEMLDRAFTNLTSLKDINLTTNSLYEGLFSGCTNLENISINGTYKTIPSYIFEGTKLKEITIPNTVTAIGEAAFKDTLITSITIPNSVTSLGANAFEGTNITNITIPSLFNQSLGYYFNNDNSELKALTDVTITNEDNITSLALANLPSLVNLTILKVNTIEANIIFNTNVLENLTIDASNLDSFNTLFGNTNSSFKYYPNNLKNVKLLNISEIPAYFLKGYTFVNLYLPASLNTFAKDALAGLELSSLYYEGSFDDWCNISHNILTNSTNNSHYNLYLKNDDSYELLEEITLYQDNIKSNALYYVKSIKKITIDSSVTEFNEGMCFNYNNYELYYNSSLTDWCNIKFKSYTNPISYTSKFYYLENDSYKLASDIVIPFEVHSLTSSSFYGYKGITSFSLTSEPTDFNFEFVSFSDLSILTLYNDGYYFGTKDNPYLFLYKFNPNAKGDASVADTTKYIYNNAFTNVLNITSLVIPDNVIKMGNVILSGNNNTALKTISLPLTGDYTYLTNIGTLGKNLEEIRFTSGEVLPDYFFKDLKTDAKVILPDNISYTYNSFGFLTANIYFEENNCKYLQSISNPYKFLIGINTDATDFEVNPNTGVILQNAISLKTINSFKISNFDFRVITAPSSNVKNPGYKDIFRYGNKNLYDNDGVHITNLYLNLAEINVKMPYQKVENLYLNQDVSLEGADFSDSTIANIYYDGTLTNYLDIHYNNKNEIIATGSNLYYKNNDEYLLLEELIIPDTIDYLYSYQFAKITSIKKVIIPTSVTTIEPYVFLDCNNINYFESPKLCTYTPTGYKGAIYFFMDNITNSSRYSIDTVKAVGTTPFANESLYYLNIASLYLANTIEGFADRLVNYTTIENIYFDGCAKDWVKYKFNSANSHPAYSTNQVAKLYFKDNDSYAQPTKLDLTDIDYAITDYAFLGITTITELITTKYPGEHSFDGNTITKLEINGVNYLDGFTPILDNVVDLTLNFVALNSIMPQMPNLKNLYLVNYAKGYGTAKFYENYQTNKIENIYYKGNVNDWLKLEFNNELQNPMMVADNFYFYIDNQYQTITTLNITSLNLSSYQFSGLNSLTTINISEDVDLTNAGKAFYLVNNVTNISMPFKNANLFNLFTNELDDTTPSFKVVKIIGDEINRGISSTVESLYLANTITTIDASFNEANISKLYYEGTIADWCNIDFESIYSNPALGSEKIFMNNEEIDNITIPEEITSIKNYQFYGFKAQNVYIPTNVLSIGRAFDANYVTTITIPFIGQNANNGNFNAIFSNIAANITTIEVLGTTAIANRGLMNLTKLENITFHNNITTIGEEAFLNCVQLRSLSIPSADSIAIFAFGGCTALESLTLPFAPTFANNINGINSLKVLFMSYSYSGTLEEAIKNANVPATLKTLTINSGEIPANYFVDSDITTLNLNEATLSTSSLAGLNSLINLNGVNSQMKLLNYFDGKTIPAGLLHVEFSNNTNTIYTKFFDKATTIKEVIIPASITSINADAFYNTNIQTIYYEGNINQWLSISFSNQYSNPLVNSNATLLLKNDDIYSEIPSSINVDLEEIKPYTLYGLQGLTNIVFSESLKKISENNFINCDNIIYNLDEDGNKYLETNTNEYYVLMEYVDVAATSITINSNTRIIYNDALKNLENVEIINVGKNIIQIGKQDITYNQNLSKRELYYEGSFDEWLNVMFTSISNLDDIYFEGTKISDVTLPNNLSIFDLSKLNYLKLDSLTIPSSITKFEGTTTINITNIYYEGSLTLWTNVSLSSTPAANTNNFYIDNVLMENELTLHEGITKINENQFRYFSKITSVILPNTVTEISDMAFANDTKLTNITIPSSIKKLGAYVFNNCPKLNYTEYENGYYLGNSENEYLVLMDIIDDSKSFTINPNTKVIAYEACTSITSMLDLTIPDGVESICDYAFFGAQTYLSTVILPNTITYIGKYGLGLSSDTTIYYKGSLDEFNNIEKEEYYTRAKIYYYSEEAPSKAGNYWRYVNNKPKAW